MHGSSSRFRTKRQDAYITMEDPSARIQSAADDIIGSIERGSIRKLRKSAFECSAKCCDNVSSDHNGLQSCVQQCSQKVARAEQMLSSELQHFQQRLQRCAMSCQDQVRDKIPMDGSGDPALMRKLEQQVVACSNACVDAHINLLGGVKRRVEDGIDRL